MPTLLVFGATGSTGKQVLEHGLVKGLNVVVFVRNPAKLPEHLRARLTVVVGDLNDTDAIRDIVKSARPDAIIDASSALPFGTKKGEPLNTADRLGLCKAVVEALEAEGRVKECQLIIVGGVVVPEPGGKINSWLFATVAAIAGCFAPALLAKANQAMIYLFKETPPTFNFALVRMGTMVEAPSRGVLKGEDVDSNMPRGSVSFCDVGAALVELATDKTMPFSRKALFFNYAAAS